MNRFFVVLSLAALSWAFVLFIVPLVPVDAWLLLAAAVALITVSRQSPAPVRAFWHRLIARTRDPVPSTT